MSEAFDLLVIGAGPAGMSAAVRADALGLRVGVLDEQATPGGQIWRNVERLVSRDHADRRVTDYAEGAKVTAAFRTSGATYLPGATVWHVEIGFRVFIRRGGKVGILTAPTLIIATGAMERPVPFPGWTLPGVLTIGAAQILLKTAGQIPAEPVWMAGNGPLLLLYVNQLLDAGGEVAGILSTEPAEGEKESLADLVGALKNWDSLMKGIRWNSRLRSLRVIRRVTEIEACGAESLESVVYRTSSGTTGTVETQLLLVHEGLIPDTHLTHALGCQHSWHEIQQCFVPVLDDWGQTTLGGAFVAGDGGGIEGAKAACAAGDIAAYGAMQAVGRMSSEQARAGTIDARKRRAKALAIRPLLDKRFRPRAQCAMPSDDTIVCRCESITAGTIRAAIREGARELNQVKAHTRCGMGACLGRLCGLVAVQILSRETGRAIADSDLFRVRPPLRPITLAELASLAAGSA